MLSTPPEGVFDEVLMGMFKNGLQEEVRAKVCLLKPKSSKELMDAAFQVEGRNLALKKVKEERRVKSGKSGSLVKWNSPRLNSSRYTSFFEDSRSNYSTPAIKNSEKKEVEESKVSNNKVTIPITTLNSSSSNNHGTKRLFEADIKRRRELGLCFKCEEKYSPNHKCKGKQLQLLVLTKEEEEYEGLGVEEYEEEIPEKVFAAMGLSHTTVMGFTSCKTMKLVGKLKGRSVVVLIDSGATHNFISVSTMKEFKVKVQKTGYYSIKVGDERKFFSNDECPDVELGLQGMKVLQIFYPFKLENVDLVLGIAWLKSL